MPILFWKEGNESRQGIMHFPENLILSNKKLNPFAYSLS